MVANMNATSTMRMGMMVTVPRASFAQARGVMSLVGEMKGCGARVLLMIATIDGEQQNGQQQQNYDRLCRMSLISAKGSPNPRSTVSLTQPTLKSMSLLVGRLVAAVRPALRPRSTL